MSYNKHAWKKGDKITAERLNNLEEGINEVSINSNSQENSAIYYVNYTLDEFDRIIINEEELLKIQNAIENNKIIVIDASVWFAKGFLFYL